jgi:hypothetical protein
MIVLCLLLWLQKREQERLEKLRQMERTDAVAALENFAQYQKSKEETLVQRLDQASDNKERKMREMKEKLERRKRHAEEVRKRKQLARESGVADSLEADDSSELEQWQKEIGQLNDVSTPRTPPDSATRQHVTTPRPDEMKSPKSPKGGAFRVRSPIMVEEMVDGMRRGSNGSIRTSSRKGSAGKSRNGQ